MQHECTPTNGDTDPATNEPGLMQRLTASLRIPTLNEAAIGVAFLIAGVAVLTALTGEADLPAGS